MDESRLRRLFQARAPVEELLSALDENDWTSLESQALICRATSSQDVGVRYRGRVLSALVKRLGKREVHEDLLEAFLAGLHGAAGADADEAWADVLFELPSEACSPASLRLRVCDVIGSGHETGGVLWPAALVLAAWLTQPAVLADLDGARVLELGAGVGLAGLVVAACARPALVRLTDNVAATLDNLEFNARRLQAATGAAGRARVECQHLDWLDDHSGARDAREPHATGLQQQGAGEAPLAPDASWRETPSSGLGGFDLVIASDVCYSPSVLSALVATLAASLAAGGGCALLANERRSDETWSAFTDALERHGGLSCRDRSAEARAVATEQSSFFCPRDVLARVSLLELRAVTAGAS